MASWIRPRPAIRRRSAWPWNRCPRRRICVCRCTWPSRSCRRAHRGARPCAARLRSWPWCARVPGPLRRCNRRCAPREVSGCGTSLEAGAAGDRRGSLALSALLSVEQSWPPQPMVALPPPRPSRSIPQPPTGGGLFGPRSPTRPSAPASLPGITVSAPRPSANVASTDPRIVTGQPCKRPARPEHASRSAGRSRPVCVRQAGGGSTTRLPNSGAGAATLPSITIGTKLATSKRSATSIPSRTRRHHHSSKLRPRTDGFRPSTAASLASAAVGAVLPR